MFINNSALMERHEVSLQLRIYCQWMLLKNRESFLFSGIAPVKLSMSQWVITLGGTEQREKYWSFDYISFLSITMCYVFNFVFSPCRYYTALYISCISYGFLKEQNWENNTHTHTYLYVYIHKYIHGPQILVPLCEKDRFSQERINKLASKNENNQEHEGRKIRFPFSMFYWLPEGLYKFYMCH